TGGDTSSGGDASTGGKKSSGGDGGATGGTGGKDAGGGTAGEGGARGEEGDLVKTLLIPGASNLYGLTYSADGKLYVSGTVDDEGDPAVALWRLDTEGNIDESFGDDGVVVRNLGAGSDASYGVVELANGDLVVHGTLDGRVFLMKFDDEGALVTEPTFVEFGWSEADLDASDEQRTDNDRWVARVLASDFSADASFNGGQAFGVDVDGANAADNTRRGFVEADGKILSAGYTNFGEGNHVALMRLTPSGQLDGTFGFGTTTDQDGLTRFQPFSGAGAMSEAYSAVKVGNRYI